MRLRDTAVPQYGNRSNENLSGRHDLNVAIVNGCSNRERENKIMKLEPIITSLLETDMYKFSMGQAIYHQFSDYKTTWTFKCRNQDVHFTPEMIEEIRANSIGVEFV